MTAHPHTAAPHGGQASTAPSLTDARAVLADITHHDARTIRHASLRILLQGTDPTERQDARAALRMIERGTIR
jgi:hypothetical protein